MCLAFALTPGRADYFGSPVNRAARLMSAAHGGQIVCDRALMESVAEEWARRYGMSREVQEAPPALAVSPNAASPGAGGMGPGSVPGSAPGSAHHVGGFAMTPHAQRLAAIMAGSASNSSAPGSDMNSPMRVARDLRSVPSHLASEASQVVVDDTMHQASDRIDAVTRAAMEGVLASPRDVRMARSFISTSFTK